MLRLFFTMDSENTQALGTTATTYDGVAATSNDRTRRHTTESAKCGVRRLARDRARWRKCLASETTEAREARLARQQVSDRARCAAQSAQARETVLQWTAYAIPVNHLKGTCLITKYQHCLTNSGFTSLTKILCISLVIIISNSAVLMQEEKMQQLVLSWNSRTTQVLAPVVSGTYTYEHSNHCSW